MKITVIGTGYVGLVSSTCFADVGNDVLCLDVGVNKIRILNEGGIPIYEPGLEAMVKKNVTSGRLRFTTNVEEAVAHGVLQFIAVGTPPDEDGSADLQYVVAAARNIGRHMRDYKVVVNKSTVPVGTADKVCAAIAEELKGRDLFPSSPGIGAPGGLAFSVVSNPEFLKEGAAVEDFMKPDRVIIGAEDARAIELMRELYEPFQRNHDRLIVMDVKSAELTKYAANAMLATRISFMNELANLAEKLGADIDLVRKGIGSDPRIGFHYLYPGVGYGGSCFPKDVQALIRTAADAGQRLKVLQAVEDANDDQKKVLPKKIVQRLGENLTGKTIALWGLAFKPNTDDMREAPSRVLIADLLARGAKVHAYDPVATHEAQRLFGDEPRIRYATTPMEALEGADVMAIVTEWKEFRAPDFEAIKAKLKQPVIFDGRNLYDPAIKEARLARHAKHPSYTHLRIDLADRKAIEAAFATHKPQRVVNLAAQAGVRYSIENPLAYIDSNIVGFAHILEGCRHNSVEHLVYASSSSVYGANTAMPFSIHQNVDHPLSLYAASKKANELMAHTYSHLYGLPTTGLRFFTVYGPWGRPDMALFKFTKAILAGEPIQIFNYGKHRRDFTYIDDIVEGVIRTLDRPAPSNPEWNGKTPDPGTSQAPWRVYNIGNNQPVELMDYIAALEKALGKTAEKELLPLKIQQAAHGIATQDIERARAGHYPTLDLVALYSAQKRIGAAIVGQGFDITTKEIGLQFAVPVFQGGAVQSRVREALANQERVLQNLNNARRNSAMQVSQQYLNVNSGIAQVKALKQALTSIQSQLDSTILGQKVGVRTEVDVLNVQQSFYSARRDLARAHYSLLMAKLRLEAEAGELDEDDLIETNDMLR